MELRHQAQRPLVEEPGEQNPGLAPARRTGRRPDLVADLAVEAERQAAERKMEGRGDAGAATLDASVLRSHRASPTCGMWQRRCHSGLPVQTTTARAVMPERGPPFYPELPC